MLWISQVHLELSLYLKIHDLIMSSLLLLVELLPRKSKDCDRVVTDRTSRSFADASGEIAESVEEVISEFRLTWQISGCQIFSDCSVFNPLF